MAKRRSSSDSGRVIGILAIDPGVTTGIDCGWWDLSCSAKQSVSEWSGTNTELCEPLLDQAHISCGMWGDLYEEASGRDCYLVAESYVQRPTTHFGTEDALAPVMLMGMVLGYLRAVEDMSVVIWQTPALAKSYATNVRLREWGAWIRGSDHRRDARRHALAFRSRASA